MPRSRPRHDHDAGGPAELLAAKAELRQHIWEALRAVKATRFPGPEGRIPNFVGAEAAAERLRGTDAWQVAGTLKANPDVAGARLVKRICPTRPSGRLPAGR